MNDYIKNIIENVKERERLVREKKKREQQEKERLEKERLEEEKLRKKQEFERRQAEDKIKQQKQEQKELERKNQSQGAGNNLGSGFTTTGFSYHNEKHPHDRNRPVSFENKPESSQARVKYQQQKDVQRDDQLQQDQYGSDSHPQGYPQQSIDASSQPSRSSSMAGMDNKEDQKSSSDVPTYNISGFQVTPQDGVSEEKPENMAQDMNRQDVSRNIPSGPGSETTDNRLSLKMHDHEKIDLDSFIRRVPDFPKQGILFYDVTTLIKNPRSFNACIKKFADRYKNMDIDLILGIESRGFIVGSALAHELGIGFVPARKPGKLPASSVRAEYELEYGKDAIEIHKDAIASGQNVLIVDDLVATGGTVKAASSLIKHLGGNIVELAFIIDLKNLHGNLGQPYFSLLEYEVDE